MRGWKAWALAIIAAVAGLAGIAQLTPANTVAHKTGAVMDKVAGVAAGIVVVLPDPLIRDEQSDGGAP